MALVFVQLKRKDSLALLKNTCDDLTRILQPLADPFALHELTAANDSKPGKPQKPKEETPFVFIAFNPQPPAADSSRLEDKASSGQQQAVQRLVQAMEPVSL